MENAINISLFPAGESLAAEIAGMARTIWTEYYTPLIGENQVTYMLSTIQSEEAIHRQIQKEGYRYFFILSQTARVGYAALRFDEDGRCFLSKIYILLEYRGKGIASEALRGILEICKKEKAQTIWLTVNIHNEKTIAAYKRMGFVITDTQKADIGNGFFMDDYIMEKRV